MTTTPRLGITQLEEGQALPEVVVNGGFLTAELGASRFVVLSKGDNSPAGGETDGQGYLVGASGSGAFLGEDNKLAFMVNGAWEFYTALEGWEIEVLDEDTSYTLRGGSWVSAAAGFAVEDEGVSEGTGIQTLNFTGAGVSVNVTGTEAEIIVGGGGGGVDVEDEGVSEATGATILNFTGAGVTATDAGGGQVDIDIPGGGGGGTSYEGGPVTEATTADLAAWVNQGTSTVTDGADSLVLKPQVDGLIHAREKTVAGSWTYYAKLDLDFLSTAAVTSAISGVAGFFLRDSSDSEMLMLGIYYERISGDEQSLWGAIIQRWTNASTFNATAVVKYSPKPWKWIRLQSDGTTLTFSVGQDGKNFTQVGTETIATFIDTVDRLGVGGIASANMTEAIITVPYFSTTAPA